MKNIIDENNIFNIITPTFNRSPDIIERCVVSVDAQIYKNWKHFVIIDAVGKTRHISQNLIEKNSSTRENLYCFGPNSNNFGKFY